MAELIRMLVDRRIEVAGAGQLAGLLMQDRRDDRESRVRIRENSG